MPSPDLRSVDLPIDLLGGMVSQFDPQKLPSGASPFNRDIIYPAGGVATRPGMQSFYAPAFAGNPTVNYLRTFVDTLEVLRQLSLDGLGNLREENPQGVLTIIGTLVASSFAQSDTYAGREWLAVSDSLFGLDIPRQWDGTNLDRVSQVGPGSSPIFANFLPPAAVVQASGAPGNFNIAVSPTGIVWGGQTQVHVPGDGFVTYFTFVTIKTTAPHGYVAGQTVTIAGSTSTPNINGVVTIWMVPTATTFTVRSYVTVPANGGGGTTTAAGGGGGGNGLVRSSANVLISTAAAHGFQVGWFVQIGGFANVAIGGGIAAVSQAGGIATVTTATAHGLVPGAAAIITGTTNYNSVPSGWIVLLVPSPTTFTFAFFTNVAAEAAGAVATPLNGTFQILTVPSATTFTYRQLGPDESSATVGTATIVGNIFGGLHQVAVSFIDREGWISAPSIPTTFYAAGNQLAALSDIATGPPNIAGRLLMFTPVIIPPAIAGPFFYINATMLIPDNTTTSAVVDFIDAVLQNGTPATNLFNQLELGECAACAAYSERMFWAGERNKVNAAGGGGGFNNLTFDGGFGTDVLLQVFPRGWTGDAVFYPGGASTLASGGAAYSGDAYRIVGNGATATRGKITQVAAVDYLGVAILNPNTAYGVRARIKIGGGLVQGTIHINLQSTIGAFTTVGISLTAAQLTQGYVEYTGVLLTPQVTIPSDLVLQIYADGTPNQNGFFDVDCIEPYPTNQPVNRTIVRASYAGNPEGFDVLTGLLIVGKDNGQAVRSMFKLLDSKLYFVKERSLYVTSDDNANEPSQWVISTVSATVGTPSVNGVGVGEAWAVIAHHDGLYIFDGSAPIKISQEIQPDWNRINWAAAQHIYVVVDTANKRIHVGAPTGVSTTPNQEFVLDYAQLNTAQEIADHPQAYYSLFAPGKVIAPGRARKWTIWNLLTTPDGNTFGANSAAMTLRNDGSFHLLRGNAQGNGKIYDQLTSQLSDDGFAINSQYQTFFFPESEQEMILQLGSHRKLTKYLTGYAWGVGTMTFTMLGAQGQRAASLSNLTLKNPDHWQFEKNVNFVAEYASILFGTNAVGAWFQMTKLCPTLQKELFTVVRGVA